MWFNYLDLQYSECSGNLFWTNYSTFEWRYLCH